MAWRPPDNTAELERLTKLMSHYETVNLDQIQQIDTLNQTHEANAKRILELEKNKVLLSKNIKSLEGRMKFDKIAADGIKKKFDLLQVEVRDLKYANDQLISERTEHVAQIAQLEEDLNHNRSDKLKFMHENANLKKQNADMMNRETAAGKDAVFARTDLLDKLQMLDQVLQTNETFKRTIESQSADVLLSTHKIFDLEQTLIATRRHVVNVEAMTAEYNHTIDVLQHEISRLRKELMDASTGVSGQSSAVSSRSGAANRSNRIATSIIQSSYGLDGEEGAYALSRRPRTEQGVSRERNRLSSDYNSTMRLGTGHTHTLSQSSTFTEGTFGSSGLLPTLSEGTARIGTSHASSRREKLQSQGGYQYKDLTEHLDPVHSPQKASLVVDGGRISLDNAGVQQTVRTHILQSYVGVVESPRLRARTAEADALLRAPHTPNLLSSTVTEASAQHNNNTLHSAPASMFASSSYTDSGMLLHSRGSVDAFSACRPIATPFRPKSQSLKAPLGLSSTGVTSTLKQSVAHMQEAYGTASTSSSGHGGSGGGGKRGTKAGRDSAEIVHARSMQSRSTDSAEEQGVGRRGVRPLSPVTLGSDVPGGSSLLYGSVSSAEGEEGREGGPDGELHVTFGSADLQRSMGGTLGTEESGARSGGPKKSKSVKAESAGKKSIFVGSGLGLKHNVKLDAELSKLSQGSTHQMLKKILGDRFD